MWLVWLIVVLVVIALAAGAFAYLQSRRRRGGVIAGGRPGRGSRR